MQVQDLIDRARSQLGQAARYRLGGGKTDPRGSTCLDEDRSADCSAFVTWCFRLPKYQAAEVWYLEDLNGGWLNTDGMWLDAHRPYGFFELLEAPLPGCLVVFPAHRGGPLGLPEPPGPKVGHCGIVLEVSRKTAGRDKDTPWEWSGQSIARTQADKVIHCSSGNARSWGDAIRETDTTVFDRRSSTIYAWPSSVEPLVPSVFNLGLAR